MAKIELTDKQLRLMQDALDLYSRVGILQYRFTLDHPSVQRTLLNSFTPDDELEVGSDTTRGKIVEIGEDYIKTEGYWSNFDKKEIKTWTDIENVKLSPDYEKYHQAKHKIEHLFGEVNRVILQDEGFPDGASHGIHHPDSKEALEAFDMIQVIRHEFWKANPKRSDITVDSNVNIRLGPKIEVELDTTKDKRKQKLKQINKI